MSNILWPYFRELFFETCFNDTLERNLDHERMKRHDAWPQRVCILVGDCSLKTTISESQLYSAHKLIPNCHKRTHNYIILGARKEEMSEEWTPFSLGYTQVHFQVSFWLNEYQVSSRYSTVWIMRGEEEISTNKNGDQVPYNWWKMAKAEGTKNTYRYRSLLPNGLKQLFSRMLLLFSFYTEIIEVATTCNSQAWHKLMLYRY